MSRYSGIRYRDDVGFEARCGDCRTYWPLDLEYWDPAHGMVRCRGCHRDSRRARDRGRTYVPAWMLTPERLAKKRAMDNARKKREREDAVRGPLLRERERLTRQRFYERDPEASRERRRDYYERLVGHPPTPGIGRPRVERAA